MSDDNIQLFSTSLADLLALIASTSSTLGGGGTAAVTGAMASALLSMVGRLTIGKKGYEQGWELSAKLVRRADQLTKEFESLAVDDIQSFRGYMKALRLSKQSSTDRRERQIRLTAATHRAITTPLLIATACKETLAVAQALTSVANRHVVSDIGCSTYLSAAAAKAAMLTAQTNINSVSKENIFETYSQRMSILKKNIDELYDSVMFIIKNS